MRVERHTGPRDELRDLFKEAEDSPEQLAAYMDDGIVLVARDDDGTPAGHLQLIDGEIRNMAVAPARRGEGVGRELIGAAIELARSQGRPTLTVATAAADVGNLRFYQRAGFRMRSIERDAFTPATGYPSDLRSDGIPVRDRVWLDMELVCPAS